MTASDGFTRLVETWLREEGVPRTPDYAAVVLARTSTTRQRPAWLSPGRWLPMSTAMTLRLNAMRPTFRYVALAALLLVLAAAVVAVIAGTSQRRLPAPFGPAANGDVYFDVDGQIVAVNAANGNRRAIDVGMPNASGPYLSPDGTKFSFVTVDPAMVASSAFWVADKDGTHPRKLSGDLRMDIDPAFNPTWSPDSTQIVFGAVHEAVDELFIAAADGAGFRKVGDQGLDRWQNPEWSPSGEWIAFFDADPEGGLFISAIHPDGTGLKRLPASAGAGDGFRGFQLWAPDLSNRIVYGIGNTADGQGDAVATMDVDTGVETILSDVPGVTEHRAAWSPDGTRIAFHLGDAIAVINADGTGLVQLADHVGAGAIGWSPDGKRIFGSAGDSRNLVAIDASGATPPIVIPLDGTEAGVFSWQRLAP